MIFIHCLQKHCEARLRKPYSLHVRAVLWRDAGMFEKGANLASVRLKRLTVRVCGFLVHVHGDFHRLRDAEHRRRVQPGFLLFYWSASGNSSDVCCQTEDIRYMAPQLHQHFLYLFDKTLIFCMTCAYFLNCHSVIVQVEFQIFKFSHC